MAHVIKVQDVPATETLEQPLDAAGFAVLAAGTYRLTWPRGHVVLWRAE